jgi:hypothetical protein
MDLMKLTSSQFLRIIETLRSDPLEGRRRTPRVGLRCKAIMVPCVEDGPVQCHEVWVRDLSVEGIGFIHHDTLPLHSFVIFQFTAKDDAGLSVLCQIVRSVRVAPKSVEIGAKIDHVLTPEELG